MFKEMEIPRNDAEKWLFENGFITEIKMKPIACPDNQPGCGVYHTQRTKSYDLEKIAEWIYKIHIGLNQK